MSSELAPEIQVTIDDLYKYYDILAEAKDTAGQVLMNFKSKFFEFLAKFFL